MQLTSDPLTHSPLGADPGEAGPPPTLPSRTHSCLLYLEETIENPTFRCLDDEQPRGAADLT